MVTMTVTNPVFRRILRRVRLSGSLEPKTAIFVVFLSSGTVLVLELLPHRQWIYLISISIADFAE